MFKFALVTVTVAAGSLLGLGVAQAKFCSVGTAILMTGSSAGPASDVAKVRRVCKPGETVGIPGNTALAIGELCDFNKQIYSSPNGLAICVLKNAR